MQCWVICLISEAIKDCYIFRHKKQNLSDTHQRRVPFVLTCPRDRVERLCNIMVNIVSTWFMQWSLGLMFSVLRSYNEIKYISHPVNEQTYMISKLNWASASPIYIFEEIIYRMVYNAASVMEIFYEIVNGTSSLKII